jgi:hypothetical protein
VAATGLAGRVAVRVHCATLAQPANARTNFTRPFGYSASNVAVFLSSEGRAFARAISADVDLVTVLRPEEAVRVETDSGLSRGLRVRTRSADDPRFGVLAEAP